MTGTEVNEYLNRLINEEEAAAYLGYSIRSLQNWRHRGGGPPFIKVSNRTVRYRRCDLDAWAEKRLVSSTAEASVRLGV